MEDELKMVENTDGERLRWDGVHEGRDGVEGEGGMSDVGDSKENSPAVREVERECDMRRPDDSGCPYGKL